jgi:hypothetical protein
MTTSARGPPPRSDIPISGTAHFRSDEQRRIMTEQKNAELGRAVCRAPGCGRPAEEGTDFSVCALHRAQYDAKAKEGAWEFAAGVLRPWVEATEPIGSEELTGIMRSALREAERQLNRALDELEEADRAVGEEAK